MRRNPVKVFFFVIMPLISGGTLAAFANQFGVRLPPWMSGKAARNMGGAYEGYYGSKGYGNEQSDISGGMGALMNMAKAFM